MCHLVPAHSSLRNNGALQFGPGVGGILYHLRYVILRWLLSADDLSPEREKVTLIRVQLSSQIKCDLTGYCCEDKLAPRELR